MSTCIRGGSTYKRHKWEIRGVQLKWYKQCKHCHAERILDNGHWRPATMEESGWRSMPKVAKLRADGVLAEAEIIAIDEETTVSSHVSQDHYVMANIYPSHVPPTLGKKALDYPLGSQ